MGTSIKYVKQLLRPFFTFSPGMLCHSLLTNPRKVVTPWAAGFRIDQFLVQLWAFSREKLLCAHEKNWHFLARFASTKIMWCHTWPLFRDTLLRFIQTPLLKHVMLHGWPCIYWISQYLPYWVVISPAHLWLKECRILVSIFHCFHPRYFT